MRIALAILLVTGILGTVGGYTALVGRPRPAASEQDTRVLRLVCSTTQVADFARQVVGDRWQVTSVLAAGQDPHLYEIKTGDAALVATADLCAENGWHLEGKEWMARLARAARKPLVTCVDGIAPYQLEEDGIEVHDPHAWFTPPNARQYVQNLLAGVVRIDPEHAEEYEARAALYLDQLEQLDRWIRQQIERIEERERVLVTSHDAFNYYCREYGLRPAAPTGWSTGEEIGGGATPERRRQVVESIRALGVRAIFVETSVNPKLIRVIAEEAGVRIGGELYSDSMGPPGSAGETYLGMMRENTLTIVEALR